MNAFPKQRCVRVCGRLSTPTEESKAAGRRRWVRRGGSRCGGMGMFSELDKDRRVTDGGR